MNIDANSVAIAIIASAVSGMATAIYGSIREDKKEKARGIERYQDRLKLELKDLKIQLYQLEKDLDEWRDKYYSTVNELLSVRTELEETLIKLSLIDLNIEQK